MARIYLKLFLSGLIVISEPTIGHIELSLHPGYLPEMLDRLVLMAPIILVILDAMGHKVIPDSSLHLLEFISITNVVSGIYMQDDDATKLLTGEAPPSMYLAIIFTSLAMWIIVQCIRRLLRLMVKLIEKIFRIKKRD